MGFQSMFVIISILPLQVQMLARELERREGISRLEEEVRDLKVAVSKSDLTHLTSSELDILEHVLVAKDRRVRAAARAYSLDSDERSFHPIARPKSEFRSPSLSSSLNKQRLSKQRGTSGGGSIENLLHKTSLLKNRLFSGTTQRHELLIARSLEETPDRAQKNKMSSGEHSRNRSASSGNITLERRASSFTLPSASSLMKGLGNFVRNSAGTSTCQTSSQNSRLTAAAAAQDTATIGKAAVPTISSTCGQVSSVSNHHTRDPLPPDL